MRPADGHRRLVAINVVTGGKTTLRGLGGARVITVISVAVALWLAQGHTTPGRHLRGGQCGGV